MRPSLCFCLRAVATLAAAGLQCCAAASDAGRALEIDLVFPRNGTYAPDHLLPIIFAVQNPQAAVGLLTEVTLTLNHGGGFAGKEIKLDLKNVADDNLTAVGNAPYFLVFESTALEGMEGHFGLIYDFLLLNCSSTELDPQGSGRPKRNITSFRNMTEFTLRSGAPAAVDGFFTSRDDCPIDVATLNVTGNLPYDNFARPGSRTLCGVLTEPIPAPTPCAVQISSALAANLSARVTDSACARHDPSPSLGCAQRSRAARPTSDRAFWPAVGLAFLFGGLLFAFLE